MGVQGTISYKETCLASSSKYGNLSDFSFAAKEALQNK